MSRTPTRSVHWNTVYETRAADAVSWFEASPDRSLGWIARVGAAPAEPVIDVGGGLSGLGGALLDLGFEDVTLLDISDTAVRRQVAARPALHGIVADVSTWRPERVYGVWHDRAVLHFLQSEPERTGYRRALEAGLRAGGHAIIATFAPDGPETCSGLPVRRYDAAGLAAFLGDDFEPLWDERFDHRTPWGAIQRFEVAIFRRR
ncbi:SAM-dependent methyltransferase [Brevundimonas sp.]|uniref:SAM-dependent methyltransferase n=1 Tax=Brevundimonas sp. TaxID=1871086 RepID=UPI0025EB4200|nr:SAM-dependent methyltransferase [Brevundimonas sp.]